MDGAVPSADSNLWRVDASGDNSERLNGVRHLDVTLLGPADLPSQILFLVTRYLSGVWKGPNRTRSKSHNTNTLAPDSGESEK